jgi:proline iminopeptidase
MAFEARFAERSAGPVITAMRTALEESGLREGDPAAFRRRAFDLSVAAYFHDPSRAHELTPFRVTGRTQQEVWESLGDYDLLPSLRGLRGIPALVVHGDDDPIPIESARATARALGATFQVIPNCGHVPHVEAPEAFVRILGGFLPAAEG